MLGIDVVRGRGFTAAERTLDAGVVVVSERSRAGSGRIATRLGRSCSSRAATRNVERRGASEQRPASAARLHRHRRRAGRGDRPRMFALNGAGVYVPIAPESRDVTDAARPRRS